MTAELQQLVYKKCPITSVRKHWFPPAKCKSLTVLLGRASTFILNYLVILEICNLSNYIILIN